MHESMSSDCRMLHNQVMKQYSTNSVLALVPNAHHHSLADSYKRPQRTVRLAGLDARTIQARRQRFQRPPKRALDVVAVALFGQHKVLPALLRGALGGNVPPQVVAEKAVLGEVAEPDEVVRLGAEPGPALGDGLRVVVLGNVVEEQVAPGMAGQDASVGLVDDEDGVAGRRVVCVVGSDGLC